MRFTRYLRQEKYIVASDTGGIVERWKWGRRFLEDRSATTPRGNLKHGVLDRLIANATAAGYKLTEQEIQRRLRCARTYQTEAEIRECAHGFQNWDQLARAGFPAVEVADPGEPYDPRDTDEKIRDIKNTLADAERQRERERTGQAQLGLYFLPGITLDTYGPESEIGDLWKQHEHIKVEVTEPLVQAGQRAKRDDQDREQRLHRLTRAVDGDSAATWAGASNALFGVSPDE
jgi:hypothetical protein